jgi:hypothetical protein
MKQVIESLKRQIRVEEAAIFANNRDQISRKIFPGYRGSPPHPERSEYLEELKKAVKILESHSADQAGEDRRKIVCYCGSLRVAMEAFKKAEYEAVLKGEIALLPCCMFVDIERTYGAESDYKQKADDLHKRKIDIADEVFVLNVGGYIGQSTRSEIDYALSIGKPVKYLEPTTH